MSILAAGDQVVRVSGASRGWGSSGVGVIQRIIPGHMDKYPSRWVDAKAVVAWPAPWRIGGSGVSRTTVALKALARPDELGACERCGRYRRLLTAGTYRRLCGTCVSREERRINTREMYGHGPAWLLRLYLPRGRGTCPKRLRYLAAGRESQNDGRM